MKIKDIAVLSILLAASSLVAADVEFTCAITGSGWTYTAALTGKTPNQRVWFGGEAGLARGPLGNPKISDKSCSGR